MLWWLICLNTFNIFLQLIGSFGIVAFFQKKKQQSQQQQT